MTTTSTTYGTRYETPEHAAPSTLVARLLARVIRALATECRVRRDMRQLMAMDEHMLKDIGLSRTQVAQAVRFGRI